MSKLDSILFHLAEHYVERFPLEAVRILEQQNLSQLTAFVEGLEPNKISILFTHLNPRLAQECLKSLSMGGTTQVFTGLPLECAAGILRFTPKLEREQLLSQLPKEISRALHTLIHFPEKSAGALMDPNLCTIAGDLTVEEAKKLIKNLPKKDFHFIYVVDRMGTLQGKVSFVDFLQADTKMPLHAIQRPPYPVISAEATFGDILSHTGWREFSELPVVDQEKRILGILHYRILGSLEEGWGEALITPLTTMMQLGETAWVGMMAAYGHFWEFFRKQLAEEKS